MTFKVPAPKENLISTPRTRSYLRKKTFMYMYVHAKQYTGYNIYWSCIRRKKGYILGKPNWDSVRYYAFNAQVDFILLLIYFWLELFFFGKKKTFAIKSSKTIIRTLTCLNKKSSTNMCVCISSIYCPGNWKFY